MTITAAILESLVALELETVADARLRAHVRSLLVPPAPVLRDWNYGRPGERYACWAVLNHGPSDTGIAYCEHGFGPGAPWGLVHLSGGDHLTSMGMDAAWYATFLDAYFESRATRDLPIWRVFETSRTAGRIPISGEMESAEAWKRVEEQRSKDPDSRYDVGHGIGFGTPRSL